MCARWHLHAGHASAQPHREPAQEGTGQRAWERRERVPGDGTVGNVQGGAVGGEGVAGAGQRCTG